MTRPSTYTRRPWPFSVLKVPVFESTELDASALAEVGGCGTLADGGALTAAAVVTDAAIDADGVGSANAEAGVRAPSVVVIATSVS